MSLTPRQQIAAQALEGYLASFAGTTSSMPSFAKAAKESVSYADALLAELERTEPKKEPKTDNWLPHTPGDPIPKCRRVRFKDGFECDNNNWTDLAWGHTNPNPDLHITHYLP